MNGAWERLWTAMMDTRAVRWFFKRSFAAGFFKGDLYKKFNLARRKWLTTNQVRQNPQAFKDVRTLCLFVGHNKSGASMLGALLDAHPNSIFSDEANTLQYIPAGFQRDQIFHLLAKNSRRERMKGRVTARRLNAYSWLVPNQWQGRYNKLEVIGDSTSGTTTRTLGRDPTLLAQLAERMGAVRVKFILVIRNPFDPISLIMIRGKRSFENAIEHYFSNCAIVKSLQSLVPPSDILPVRYEDFVVQPERKLKTVCDFLGLETTEAYLKDCASIFYSAPETSRARVSWDERWIRDVEIKMLDFDFLQGYSFRE